MTGDFFPVIDAAATAAGIRFRRGIATYRNCPVATLVGLAETGFAREHLAAYVCSIPAALPEQIDRVLEWASARGLMA
jgi:hypothetical protein